MGPPGGAKLRKLSKTMNRYVCVCIVSVEVGIAAHKVKNRNYRQVKLEL